MITDGKTLIIFSNASYRSPVSGCGFFAHLDGALLLGSRSLPDDTASSVIAEERAAEIALAECLRHLPAPKAIHFIIDSQVVAAAFGSDRSGSVSVRNIVEVATRLAAPVSASWIKGHCNSSRGDHFANGVADKLSRLGRAGEIITLQERLVAGWRDAILAFDPRLDPSRERFVLSGKQTAERLGVSYEDVMEMVRLGKLPVDRDTGGIPQQFIDELIEERSVEPEMSPATL